MSEHDRQDVDIKDLPAEETLTPEEKERLAGSGRFRPTLEALEARDMMSANPMAPVVPAGGGAAPEVGHMRALASSTTATTAERPAGGVLGSSTKVVDLHGQDLRATDLSKYDLRGANLSGANLSGKKLSGMDLSGANLTNAILIDADFSGHYGIGILKATGGANLTGADLRGANMQGTFLQGANLSGTNLSGLDLTKLKTEYTTPLRDTVMTRTTDLSGANLSGVNLQTVNLTSVNLRGAILVGTKFGDSAPNQPDADLKGADLRGANLTNADLTRVDMRLADLRDATLTDATLIYANLEGALLEGVEWTGAKFASVPKWLDTGLFVFVKLADGYKVGPNSKEPEFAEIGRGAVNRGPSGDAEAPPARVVDNPEGRLRSHLSLPSLGYGTNVLRGGIDENGNLVAGSSDNSAATVVTTEAGEKFLLVAGDEDQNIRMYKWDAADKEYDFVKCWDVGNKLGLEGTKEVDIEAVTRIDNKLYWIGSGSNRKAGGKDGADKFLDAPNRDRIFRTDITVVNGQPELKFVGYTRIEGALIRWDDSRGSPLGLAKAADGHVDPKTTAGYNIEGLVTLPDGSVGIAFRASGSKDGKALIVPVTNLDKVLTLNGNGETPKFGEPISLDLGGRGIRDIVGSTYKDAAGATHWQYLIIAGPAGAATGINDNDFRLYTWSGKAGDKPVMHNANLIGLSPEAIVLPAGNAKWDANTEFELISDCGATMFDNNVLGKDQSSLDKKSRIDVVKLGAAVETGYESSRELTGTRRQDNLKGENLFSFEARSGSSGYFEILGAGREDVIIEVGYYTSEGFVKVAESKYDSETDTNLCYFKGKGEGNFAVRVVPVSGDPTETYTLSWKV